MAAEVAEAAPAPLSGGSEALAATRRLADLRVIDLRAELKRRNLDAGGNKSILLERLRKAIEEEGGDPEEVPVPSEAPPKKAPKRSSKGRRLEEEEVEDNGLGDNSGDGQEDLGATLDPLQDMDMMDMSVLDEAEIDDSGGAERQEEEEEEEEEGSANSRLDSLFDSKKGDEEAEPPGELVEDLVGNPETPPHLPPFKEESEDTPAATTEGEDSGGRLDLAAADFGNLEEPEDFLVGSENEKILDILGDTCKSEPLKVEEEEEEEEEEDKVAEEPPEAEQAQEESRPWPGQEATEEDALEPTTTASATTTTRPDEDLLDSGSPSGPSGAPNEEEEGEDVGVVRGKPSDQRVEEAALDSDSLAVEESRRSGGGGGGGGGESSEGGGGGGAQMAEADSETDAGPPQVASPEAEKTEAQAKSEEESSSATKETSAQEGGDQNTSSHEGIQAKAASKDEKGSSSSSSSSGRNLWVSGLSSATRATDLKNVFSKHGKVVGAKVVTNARSPGARCYGFVTMSSSEEATKCIAHLHRTELHGRMISVERAKNEPAGKKALPDKKENDAKKEKDRRHSTESRSERSLSLKKEEKADRKEEAKKEEGQEGKEGGKTEEGRHKARSVSRARSTQSASKGTERTVVMDKSKGEPVISVKTSSTSKERSTKSHDRKSESKEKQDILSFDKIKEQRERERQRQREREVRESERRRERERLQSSHAWDERQRLERERDRLHFQRQRLERERLERERLERERLRVEHERRREQERIQREREELRRQQEQLRYEQERRSALRRPYEGDPRRDDSYWPEPKRVAMDDRYHFSRQDRFHGFDHHHPRDRGRYQDHPVDRRESSRSLPDGDGQRYPDDRHGGPERPPRDSWGGYGAERRLSKGRGVPPPSRDGRDWDHGRKAEGHPGRPWPSASDGGMMGREHERWQGSERNLPGQSAPSYVTHREVVPGRGGFVQGGAPDPGPQGAVGPGGFAGQERPIRPSDPRFPRHY